MSGPISTRLTVLLFLATGTLTVCAAQTYTPPPPPLTTLPPCPVPKDEKEAKKIAKRKDCDPTNRPLPPAPKPAPTAANSAAQKFPYPGDQSAKPANASAPSAAKAFPFPGETSPAAPPSAPAESAAKRFPYPGEAAASPAPAPSPVQSSAPPAPESSSSSSSTWSDDAPSSTSSPAPSASTPPLSDDDDDGKPQLTDKGSEGKRNKKTVKPQTDIERVDEDLSVAKFYGQSGNAMGAYLRAKDAVKTEPDLPEARFVMGEAAKRLHKNDEAKAEFGEYLKLAPDGEHARAVEKALSELR